MRTMYPVLVGTCLALVCSSTYADQCPDNSCRNHSQVEESPASFGPSTSGSVVAKSYVELLAGSEKGQATVAYAFNRFGLQLQTPIDKEDKTGRFANLDGLVNSTRLTVTYNLFDTRGFGTIANAEADRQCIAACTTARRQNPNMCTVRNGRCDSDTFILGDDEQARLSASVSADELEQIDEELGAQEEKWLAAC